MLRKKRIFHDVLYISEENKFEMKKVFCTSFQGIDYAHGLCQIAKLGAKAVSKFRYLHIIREMVNIVEENV